MSAVLDLRDVRKAFALPGGGTLHAVDGVSLALQPGEALGLVGESGSGKTTLGRMLVGLLAPDAGQVLHRGATLRGPRPEVQMVFQDSAAALSPRRTVGESVMLPLLWNRRLPRAAAQAEARALLARVGLAEALFARLPHTLSGGQRQRVGIARALASDPDVLVADEPVSALDVSVRAQVLRLFAELRAERRLASLFITHDLGVVRAVTQRVAVMYRGRVVEQGETAALMERPLHPYSQALRAATPVPDPDRPRAAPPPPPDAGSPEAGAAGQGGCAFRARCPLAMPACARAPGLRPLAGRLVACHAAG